MISRGSQERRPWTRHLVVGLLAVSLQVPLFIAFMALNEGRDVPEIERKRKAPIVGRFIKRNPPKDEEVDEPLPDNAQIVEVNQPEEPEPKKVETKYVADKTVRTKKRTRSRVPAPPDKAKKAGTQKIDKPSEVQSKDSDSPDPTTTSKQDQQVALLQPKQKLPEADKGRQSTKSVLQSGSSSKLLLPSTSAAAERHNLQALSGTFTSDDHLEEERADSTLLDANKYKFADFFYRVKDAVRRHWHPNDVYRRRDPTGKIYGVKDRHTVLSVTLDARGRLKSLVTKKHSGLDFMDAEAKGAFRRAQPFPNPPQGLVQGGEVRFEFGFYFEISSGRHKFRWKRL